MKYNLRTKAIELTPTDQQQLDEKLARLEKHVMPPFVTDIAFEHSTHHRHGDTVTCTISIEQGKKVFHTERSAQTIQNALDEALEAMRRELKKEHDKHKRHRAQKRR